MPSVHRPVDAEHVELEERDPEQRDHDREADEHPERPVVHLHHPGVLVERGLGFERERPEAAGKLPPG